MCTKNPMSVGLSAVLRCVCASVFTRVSIRLKKNIDTNDMKNAHVSKVIGKSEAFSLHLQLQTHPVKEAHGLNISELQTVGVPAPMTHNFSKWRVTFNVYAPGWHVIKMKNLPTNLDQAVPLGLTTPLRSLQTEYRKRHQTTASLRVQNIADSGGRTSAALPSVAASD